ncbi:MAG: DUF58 domain-containing protein [Candidatus Omnitrophica bacterium]|nr:DUF58 domain-containing protein [Candidatus Omnitrophota bacterium]
MIPKEILRQVKRIEIRTTRLVNDMFGGEYESVFKGRGIEFADVREYVPGDDIRTIDWNVTARSQRPFVKKFVEERQLTVLFLVDASSSCYFGTSAKTKSEIAAEICALLAFSAVKNNDRIGVIFFTDRIEKYIPVKKGRTHVLRVIREILFFQPRRKKTDLRRALEYIFNVLTRRAIIFIVSDFLAADYEKPLKILSKEHDVVAVNLIDPKETELPKTGLIEWEDAETGERVLIDTGNEKVLKTYRELNEKRLARLDSMFKHIGVDRIIIDTSKSYIEPLMKFFALREKRL